MGKKINISFHVDCRFSQEVTVTDELYNRLILDADQNDIREIENKKVNDLYCDIQDIIDWKDILELGDFEDISITEIPQNCV
jgi:hypothetical protein